MILSEHSDAVLNRQLCNCTGLFSNKSHDRLRSALAAKGASNDHVIRESTDSATPALEMHKESDLSESSTAESLQSKPERRRSLELTATDEKALLGPGQWTRTVDRSRPGPCHTMDNFGGRKEQVA